MSFPIAKGFTGRTGPSFKEPRHFQRYQPAVPICSPLVEVQGDGVANGTLVLSIAVPANHTLSIFGIQFNSKTAAKRFLGVESDLATVGGVETPKLDLDLPAAGQMSIMHDLPIATMINATAVQRFFNIYMPQARAGVATNNAAGQYAAVSVTCTLESHAAE